jgi:hypothetical protein
MGEAVNDFVIGHFFFVVRIPTSHLDTLKQQCNSYAVTTSTNARTLKKYETVYKSGIDKASSPKFRWQQAAHTVTIPSVSDWMTSVTSRWYT